MKTINPMQPNPKIYSIAAKIMRDGRYSAAAKSVAAFVLAQARPSRKK